VIGIETIAQMEMSGDEPDVIIGCVGGGSNFGAIAFPWLGRRLRGEGKEIRFVAAEPAACPTLTRGVYRYDFGDTVGLTPLMPVYTLGHDFVPPPVHAGGLRYHGDSPLLCALVKEKLIEARAMEEAQQAREAGEPRVILFNLCGHGNSDLAAYDAFLAGELEDPEFSEADMQAALARLPEAPAIA